MDDGLEIEHGIPVAPQNVQAHGALKIDIRMVNLSKKVSVKYAGDGHAGARTFCRQRTLGGSIGYESLT